MADTQTLARAIQRGWPGAGVVIRGGVVERWDGPMPRPSDAEIDAAVAAYVADEPALELDREARDSATHRGVAALAWVLLRRMFPADTVAQTKAKHAVMRDDLMAAFKAQPWR